MIAPAITSVGKCCPAATRAPPTKLAATSPIPSTQSGPFERGWRRFIAT